MFLLRKILVGGLLVFFSESYLKLYTHAGCIGIVDYDTVEISNLHRQVLHTESRVNISKAESIKIQLNKLVALTSCCFYLLYPLLNQDKK